MTEQVELETPVVEPLIHELRFTAQGQTAEDIEAGARKQADKYFVAMPYDLLIFNVHLGAQPSNKQFAPYGFDYIADVTARKILAVQEVQ